VSFVRFVVNSTACSRLNRRTSSAKIDVICGKQRLSCEPHTCSNVQSGTAGQGSGRVLLADQGAAGDLVANLALARMLAELFWRFMLQAWVIF